MIKQFTYDVKLIVQHKTLGELEFITKTYEVGIEIGEYDYYIPFVVSNESVKNDMEAALLEFADSKGYSIYDLQVITTEVSTNDDMIDIRFSENPSQNSYERNPSIAVEFLPQAYKPSTPQYFRGDYDSEGFIYWQWENVPNCAYRLYDEKDTIIGEVGVEQRFFIENINQKGINYTRKIVAFNADGESDPSSYAVVYAAEDIINDTGVSENRFGYVDIGEITPAKVNVERLSCFKSGIGDNLDLFSKPSAYTTYEKYSFDTIVEGYLVNKQKHFTSVPVTYKIHATGSKETDGPIDGEVNLKVKPWPITSIRYSLESVVFKDIVINYSWRTFVTFQKKRIPLDNPDSGLGTGTGGSGGGGTSGSGGTSGTGVGDWIGGIGTDENHSWNIIIGGNTYNPSDIIWSQIAGDGSIIINPDGTVTGDLPGDFVLEGTLPNGDKVFIEGEVLPPQLDIPGENDVIYDQAGNVIPPVTPVPPGESGDGGGTGGGIIPRPDQIPDDDEHDPSVPPSGSAGHCPCIYIYETTSTKLKFTVGGRLMDNTLATFDIHKDPPRYNETVVPPEYIDGCLCCKETDDISAISIDDEGILTGNHVGRSHVYCTYKGKTFHFHVHVVPLYIRIAPQENIMKVGESVQYDLYRSTYQDFSYEENVTSDTKWTIDNKCTIDEYGFATGQSHGIYKVYATYSTKSTYTSGMVLKPTMRFDYSTSQNQEITDSYCVKIDKKIKAITFVNDKRMNPPDITYTVGNNSIITVDKDGFIKGIAEGTTTLTATYKGYSITTNVTVIDRIITITPSKEYSDQYDFGICTGETQQINVYDDGVRVYYTNLTFSSNNNTISVNSRGLVTGEIAGDGTITVRYRGKSYIVKGKVSQSVLTIEPNPIKVEIDGDVYISAYLNGKPVKGYKLVVTDTALATASDYIITGKALGTTSVTVTYNSLSCIAQLEVIPDADPDNKYTLIDSSSFRIRKGVDTTFAVQKKTNSGVAVPLDDSIEWEIINSEIGSINKTTGEFTSSLTPYISSEKYEYHELVEGFADPYKEWDGMVYARAHIKNTLHDFYKIFKKRISSPSLYIASSSTHDVKSLELWMYNPDGGNLKTTDTITLYDQSGMMYNTSHIKPSDCDITIYGREVISIAEDGIITPLKAGEAKVELTTFNKIVSMDITVYDHVVITMSDGSNIAWYQQSLIPFKPGLVVNGALAKAEDYEIIPYTNCELNKDGEIVPLVYGSAAFYIVYDGKQYSKSFSVSKPALKIELDKQKEPEETSKLTGNLWPDLYKLSLNESVKVKAYVNNVEIPISKVAFSFDAYYGEKLFFNIANSTVSGNIDSVQRIRAKAFGSDNFTFEIEVGTIRISHNDIRDIPLGSTFKPVLIDSIGNQVLPFNASSSEYENPMYDVFFETLDDKIFGQCASVSIGGTCKVIQGGMKNKMTIIYMPRKERLPLSDAPLEELLFDKRVTFSEDYRPRYYETTIISAETPQDTVCYFYGKELKEGDTISPNLPTRYSLHYDKTEKRGWLNWEGDTYGWVNSTPSLSIVITEDIGKSLATQDTISMISRSHKIKFLTDTPTNKIINGIVRVSGKEIKVKIDLRWYLAFSRKIQTGTIGGCDHHTPEAVYRVDPAYNLLLRPGDVGLSKLVITRIGLKYYSGITNDSYGDPASAPHTSVYTSGSGQYGGSEIDAQYSTNHPSISISDRYIGANSEFDMATVNISSDDQRLIPITLYLYGNGSTIDEILNIDMPSIIPINSYAKVSATYKYGAVDKKELMFDDLGMVFDLVFGKDMTVLSTKPGYHPISLRYKDIRNTKSVLFTSSDKPPIKFSNYSSTESIGNSKIPDIQIDGYSNIHSIPSYRYCKITSSDPSIISVSKYNLLTFNNIGKATITVQFMNTVEEFVIEVKPRSSSYLKADYTIVGPMEIVQLSLKLKDSTPFYVPQTATKQGYTVASSIDAKYYKLTTSGDNATFVASSYGTYTISYTYMDNNITTKLSTVITVTNVSAKPDIATYSIIDLPPANQRLLPHSPVDAGLVVNEEYRAMMKEYYYKTPAYDIPVEPSYFVKSKELVYNGTLTISSAVSNVEVFDAMKFVKTDSEVAASPPGTIMITSSEFVSCNRDDVTLDEYDNKVYLTCGAEDSKYRCIKNGIVTLDIKDNNNTPLIDMSEVVLVNQKGEVYTGSKMPNNKLSYVADKKLASVVDIKGTEYPDEILNAMPVLIAKLKEQPQVIKNILLNDNLPAQTIGIGELLGITSYDACMFEINAEHVRGPVSIKDTKNDPIKTDTVTFIKSKISDNYSLIVSCKPSVVVIPWNESSQELHCTVNGQEPMRNDGDGVAPYQTIAETFDTTGVTSAVYTVEIIDSNGKNISAQFDNEIVQGATMVNGDILTFTSNFSEFVDVYTRVICSTISSNNYEIDSSIEESIISDVYNPFYDYRWKNTNLVNTRVSAVSSNPNVIVYPVEQEVDFKSPENIGMMKIPSEFKVKILSPSQGCWAPLIHPGHYFINNDEHFLYRNPTPTGEYLDKEVHSLKEFFAHIRAVVEVKTQSPEASFEFNTIFTDGTFSDSILDANNITITTDAIGEYETKVYSLQKPTNTINVNISGTNTGSTNFYVCTRTESTWSDWVKINKQDTISGKLINGIKFKCILAKVEVYDENTDTTEKVAPIISSIHIRYTPEEWEFAKNIDKTILCTIPMDAEQHNATDKTINDIIYPDIVGSGLKNPRVREIIVNTIDNNITIEYAPSGDTPIFATCNEISTGIMKTNYFKFNKDGIGFANPIPRLGRPVCIKSKDKYLRHITSYDEEGNLSLSKTEEFVFDGVMAIALTYHDIDSLVVTVNDKEVPIKKQLNNMVYLDQAYKIGLGATIVATYKIRYSFYVDYNYDIPNNTSKIQVYLNELDSDYESLEVWYECDEDGEYYADEVEINPLYNVLNSGFIYITDDINSPESIEIYMTDTEFKFGTDEYTYAFVKVTDSIGNPVPNTAVEAQTLNGKIEMSNNITNKFGVVRIKYFPASKVSTVDQLMVSVAGTTISTSKEIKIVDAISPVFMLVKPVYGEYVVTNGSTTRISVQLLTDYLSPSKFTPVRVQLLGDKTTNISARTNDYGYCEFEVPIRINKDIDICRLEVTSIGVTEYLDLKVV